MSHPEDSSSDELSWGEVTFPVSSKSVKMVQAAITMIAASTNQLFFFLLCSIGYNALSSAKIHNFALITKIFHFSLFTFHFLLYLCTRLNTKAATMAQLVEQRIRNAWVRGSSPRSGSQKACREFCWRALFFCRIAFWLTFFLCLLILVATHVIC